MRVLVRCSCRLGKAWMIDECAWIFIKSADRDLLTRCLLVLVPFIVVIHPLSRFPRRPNDFGTTVHGHDPAIDG